MRKKIVCIGGGTGLYSLLMGLKEYDIDLVSVVSMMDNGGSTGLLRDEFGVLPPGDIRRSLVAMSKASDMMKDLFSYRFNEGSFTGHSFGNLFLTALTRVTGSDERAIIEAGNILNISGKVLPVTLDNVNLCALLEDGQVVFGESNIDKPKHDGAIKIERVYLEPNALVYQRVLDELKNADMIVISPGDLFTSIMPNLLVEGVSDAILQSDAKKVMICNLVTKHGETNGFSASDHLNEVEKYLGGKIDILVVNNSVPSLEVYESYKQEKSFSVEYDYEAFKDKSVTIIEGDFVREGNFFRHDSEKISKVIYDLLD